MKCLEREQLFAFAHGMLETQQADVVRGHVAGCAACQEVVREYLRLDSTLDEWKPVEPSAGFDARVRQAVEMQGEARGSSLWGGLFALTWARWLAPASLAVIVGVVALGLYRSQRIWGPAAPESSVQRPSPAPPYAPQPSAEAPQDAVIEKKSVSALGAPSAKQKAGSLMANQEAPAQSARRLAERENAIAGAALQASQAGRSEAAPRPYGAVAGAAPSVEPQSDFLARAPVEPETAAKASTSTSAFGALTRRPKEAQNQPQRVLQTAQSASVSAEAQPQATPAPPAPAGAAAAQVPTALGSLGHQLVATPKKAPSSAKSSSMNKAQALASGLSNAPPPGLLETFLGQHPDANLNKELLGRLEGREGTRATFTALVASDPADPAIKVGGLEVQLENGKVRQENGTRNATAYLDDDREFGHDNLKEIQENLARFSDKDKAPENCRYDGDNYGDWGATLMNRRADSTRYWPRSPALKIGWYRQGGVGLVITSVDPDAWFYFPGAELSEVIKMIAKGRAFLDAN